MTQWINNRFNISLKENDLKSIKDFSLIWNIFEATVCQTNFSVATAEKSLRHRQFNLSEFEPFLNYFKSRYITNNATNGKFNQLHFRNNDRRDLVESVLLGTAHGEKQIILALIIIVFRFRNNLFHGLKDIRYIDQQKDNFDNANNFLKTLLNYF